MGKLIYLISLLSGIDKLSFILSWLTIPITVFAVCVYIANSDVSDEEKMKNDISKIISKGILIIIISVVTTVLIPRKEDLYLIALTKDYTKEEVHQMSKNEIKETVDYIFEKIEDVKE